jgi:hypothetical protein
LHRLDRTSFAWRTHSITSSADENSHSRPISDTNACAKPVRHQSAEKMLADDARPVHYELPLPARPDGLTPEVGPNLEISRASKRTL